MMTAKRGRKRGQITVRSGMTRRMVQFINSLNGNIFSIRQVRETTGAAASYHISGWLSTNKSKFRRIGRGIYQHISGLLETRRPSATVAEAVWQVFCENNQPLFRSEIIGKVEEKIGDGVSAEGAVGNVLKSWHDQGVLIRHGKSGSYSYQKKTEITTRPIVRLIHPDIRNQRRALKKIKTEQQ